MSQLIQSKALEQNATIKTITNEDMLDTLKEAADRGDSVVPHLTTRVSLAAEGAQAAEAAEAAEGAEGALEKK